MNVPRERVLAKNDAPLRPERSYVLYWMIAARRTRRSFALDRALELCAETGRPLLVLEALRVDYPYASDRLHRFVLDGMRDQARRLASAGIAYYPYVEPSPGAGRGLVEALARGAAAVVTDDWPCLFLPRMVAAVASRLDVRLEAVDGNGLVPLRRPPLVYPTAYAYRRWIQKSFRDLVRELPSEDPLALDLGRGATIPPAVVRRYPPADSALLAPGTGRLAALPIDHTVAPVAESGGEVAALARLREFIDRQLSAYAEHRNEPERDVTSRLSPYLHFGQVAAVEVLAAILAAEDWSEARLSRVANGRREGFFGVSATAEAFLDQLVTWRELGFNFSSRRTDAAEYASLPAWALATLAEHARDPREWIYDLDAFAAGRTHDRLWNAAQIQLRTEGRIHNYLRMLWGKKILEWSASPEEAHRIMVVLNDRYAVDGRDPNSYSGISWVLGRYDRPWGPVRQVFGTIRYMSSANTARKVDVDGYLARHAPRAVAAERGLFDE